MMLTGTAKTENRLANAIEELVEIIKAKHQPIHISVPKQEPPTVNNIVKTTPAPTAKRCVLCFELTVNRDNAGRMSSVTGTIYPE